MSLLTGILMIGVIVSFIALIVKRNRTNLTTFVVALVLWLVVAAITGNAQ